MAEFKNINNLKVKYFDGDITPGCLVLEGGAFRGIYTAGVLDYFMEHNLNIKTCYGVSAKSTCNIVSSHANSFSFKPLKAFKLFNFFNKFINLP